MSAGKNIKDFIKYHTSRPFTPSKILGLFFMAMITLILLSVLLFAFGIITPASLATIAINIIGEDVDVTEINDSGSYFEFEGLRIVEGSWQGTLEGGELLIEHNSAYLCITALEKELSDPENYLLDKGIFLSSQLQGNGASPLSQKSTISGHEVHTIISETQTPKMSMTIWYCEEHKKMYIINALYEDRADVQAFLDLVECHHGEDANEKS